MSGGLDSSSVAVVARELRARDGGALHTFSAVFDDVPESDERRFIDAVVASGGFIPHYVRGDAASPLPDDMAQSLGYPFFASNLFVHRLLFVEARAAGVTVWLDGLDGDTTVSHGTAYLVELARRGRLRTLWRESGMVARRLGHGSAARTLHRAVMNPLLLDPVRRVWHRVRRRSPWDGIPIRPAFAARTSLADRVAHAARMQAAPASHAHDHQRRMQWGLHPFVLETLDALARPFGLEPRYPFYDWRLMEFSLALPPEQKLRDGWGRWVLRNAVQGLLPDMVQWREGKGNPGPNFVRALARHECEAIAEMIRRPGFLEDIVDVARLVPMLDRLRAATATDADVAVLWRALTLHRWGARA